MIFDNIDHRTNVGNFNFLIKTFHGFNWQLKKFAKLFLKIIYDIFFLFIRFFYTY